MICTANVARSPLFALRLQAEADRRLGDGNVEVASAGTHARLGDRAAPGSRKVAATWGSTLDEHRALPLGYVDLAAIPLIVTMTRAHRRQVVARDASVAPRSFVLRELTHVLAGRLASEQAAEEPAALPLPSPERAPATERIDAVVRLADGHRPKRLRGRRWDVPDPIDADQTVYDTLGERFVDEAELLADALFGPDPVDPP